MKIELLVDENRKFAEIAFLIDRPDFLTDIIQAREQVIDRIFSREEYKNSYSKEIKKFVNLKHKSKQEQNFENLNKDFPIVWRGTNLANRIRTKYKKDPYFEEVILAALYCNVIQEEDFKPETFWQKLDDKHFDPWNIADFKINPRIAIIINPYSTVKELKKAFMEAKEEFDRPLDTFGNIKRDRDWYWLKQEGLSYSGIQKRYVQNGFQITRDGVIKAIQQYAARLRLELYSSEKPLQ